MTDDPPTVRCRRAEDDPSRVVLVFESNVIAREIVSTDPKRTRVICTCCGKTEVTDPGGKAGFQISAWIKHARACWREFFEGTEPGITEAPIRHGRIFDRDGEGSE